MKFSEILSSKRLFESFKELKSRDYAGIDGKFIKDYEKNLEKNIYRLKDLVLKGKYIPKPVLLFNIPKNIEQNKFRTISLACIEDRIIQKSIATALSPIFEKCFSPASFAYRSNTSHRKLIGKIISLIQKKEVSFVVSGDIHHFFDNINHSLLLDIFKEKISSDENLIYYLSFFLKNGAVDKKKRFVQKPLGLYQGYVISPLLANLYLTELDLINGSTDCFYYRYGDNILFLGKDENLLIDKYNKSENYLSEKRGLELNEEDFQKKTISDGFDFLGLFFDQKQVLMSEKKKKKRFAEISAMFLREETTASFKADKIANIIATHKNYYGMVTNKQQLFEEFDNFIIKELSKSTIHLEKNELVKYLTNFKFHKELEIKAVLNKVLEERATLKPQNFLVEKKLEIQKKTYKKRLNISKECLVLRSGTSIRLKNDKFVVTTQTNKNSEISFSQIKTIQIQTENISLTAAVIKKAIENNIAIHFSDTKGKPFAQIISPDFSSTESGKNQLQAHYNGKSEEIAKEIVAGKIRNQKALIKYCSKSRKANKSLRDIVEKFSQLTENAIEKISNLKKETHKELCNILMGIEGNISAEYWRIFGLIIDKSDFIREHQNAQNVVNKCLNYGYGILYHRVYSAIINEKMITSFSYLHAEQRDKPTLVFDLIEQFRAPAVERTVISMFNKGFDPEIGKDGNFKEDSKKKLAEYFIKRLHASYSAGKKETSIDEQIREKIKQFREWIEGERPKYKSYSMDW